jgi:phosphinothricin acetyltransferase
MIRRAQTSDLRGIIDIYNHAIAAQFQTAITEPYTEEEGITWLQAHLNDNYPIFILESGKELTGWISVSPYRQGRAALRHTIEVSYYVHKDHWGKGIGSQLLNYALSYAKTLHYQTAIAIILDKNSPSIGLVEKHGFEKWGHLPDVAIFNGIECGHVYYGIKL